MRPLPPRIKPRPTIGEKVAAESKRAQLVVLGITSIIQTPASTEPVQPNFSSNFKQTHTLSHSRFVAHSQVLHQILHQTGSNMVAALINFRQLINALASLILITRFTIIGSQATPFGVVSQYKQLSEQQQKFHSSNSNQQQFNFLKYFGQELTLFKLQTSSDSSGSSNNATCNDGSPAGYYMRLNRHSKRWIIYLQGGFFCASDETCRERWLQNPDLMSSNNWPEFKTVNGMLSNDPKENPYLWNANHIFVPYCTSDAWTGQRPKATQTGGSSDSYSSSFSFMGSVIVKSVMESLYEHLPSESSLYQSKYILLAGDSAGALGVMLNLDGVVDQVTQKSDLFRKSRAIECSSSSSRPSHCLKPPRQTPIVRGLADSGWFLDKESTGESMRRERHGGISDQEEDSTAGTRFSALDIMRQASFQWNAQIPNSCVERYPEEPWRCYFGYLSYTTLKTPLFVVQWLYDEVQFLVDNIARSGSSSGLQLQSAEKVLDDLRGSLENVTALFAPSCFSHSLVIKSSWNHINVNGFKLPYILDKWEEHSMQTESTPVNDEHIRLSDETNSERQSIAGRFRSANELASFKQNQESRASLNNRQTTSGISNQNSRPARTRKRKRNNIQRTKQIRSRFEATGESAVINHESLNYQTYSLDASPSSSTTSPLQDLLPLVDGGLAYHETSPARSQSPSQISNFNPRSSRSTYEEPLMVANHMPDDSGIVSLSREDSPRQQQDSRWNSPMVETRSPSIEDLNGSSLRGKPHEDAAFFRLIDTCGTPQCNRNCPLSEMDFDISKLI